MRHHFSLLAALSSILISQCVSGLQLDLTSTDSKKAAAKTVAFGMLDYYKGKTDPAQVGLLPSPYYWWMGGAMMGSLIDYWRYTGDTQYVNLTTAAMLAQVGQYDNFEPIEQAKQLGNDDQAFWGMSAMAAAEYNFPNPPEDKPQWLELAQAVFNRQAPRWDNATCNGGFRWQMFVFNTGYSYKNTISNGCFFNLAARLHAYTGNTTYLDWAKKTWDWTKSSGLITSDYGYIDGTSTENCSNYDYLQWSYNPAIYMHGLAVLYNKTEDNFWKTSLDSTWKGMNIFFTNGSTSSQPTVAYEQACEPSANCNVDQASFKGYLARWMAATTKLAPHLATDIRKHLDDSAAAAAASCSGGTDGVTCGLTWLTGKWDGKFGLGMQMSALETIQSTLIDTVGFPLTNTTGGTSKGNYLAGTEGVTNPLAPFKVITTADKAGAGILTILVVVGMIGGAWWLICTEDKPLALPGHAASEKSAATADHRASIMSVESGAGGAADHRASFMSGMAAHRASLISGTAEQRAGLMSGFADHRASAMSGANVPPVPEIKDAGAKGAKSDVVVRDNDLA